MNRAQAHWDCHLTFGPIFTLNARHCSCLWTLWSRSRHWLSGWKHKYVDAEKQFGFSVCLCCCSDHWHHTKKNHIHTVPNKLPPPAAAENVPPLRCVYVRACVYFTLTFSFAFWSTLPSRMPFFCTTSSHHFLLTTTALFLSFFPFVTFSSHLLHHLSRKHDY